MIDFKKIIGNVRNRKPLIHNITNYVTVNDCANIILACGGSPIMSDDKDDIKDIMSICDGLNINIGTLNKNTVSAMFFAGKCANKLGHPVLLDPVGAGATKLRTNTALELIDSIKFSVIRGNISEIKALVNGTSDTKGVDADEADKISNGDLDEVVKSIGDFAKKMGSVIVVTGENDLIIDGERVCKVTNGNFMMSRITGAGCMLSAMMTAFIAANSENKFEAACASVIAMGVCGEIAYQRLNRMEGNSSYRNYIIDAVYNMTSEQVSDGARYEMR